MQQYIVFNFYKQDSKINIANVGESCISKLINTLYKKAQKKLGTNSAKVCRS